MIPGLLQDVPMLFLARQNAALTGNHWLGFVAATDICAAAQKLLQAGYHLEDVSGLDAQEGFVVAYTFDHMASPARVSLRVAVPHDNPVLPSIAAIYPGADWHEREAYDFFGLTFSGHPNLIPLLLPDDMKLRPLVKEQGKRAALFKLMGGARLGEVVRKAEGFTLLDAPESAEEPAKSGGKA